MNRAALKIVTVAKSFGGSRVVDGVSMVFERGTVTGIIGPNGAGKTTLFNIINGFLTVDSGEVLLDDQRIDGLPPWRIAGLGVGRVFQDIRIFARLTVLENVLLACTEQRGENPLHCLFLRRRCLRQESANIKTARDWLGRVGLAHKSDILAGSLSYGERKLLSIARLLAGNYSILLLDEPTAGVNPVLVETILGIIRELVSAKRTVIMIEHNIQTMRKISDFIYFMHEGRVAFSGKPLDVVDNHAVRETYIGI